MKYAVRILLCLLVLGLTFIGCYLKPGVKSETEPYTGPQTVAALMETFDDRYSAQAYRWANTAEIGGERRHIKFTLTDVDAEYPRAEWLQLLLNRGITINTLEHYSSSLNIRANLVMEEFRTGTGGEKIKIGYIDTQIQRYQRVMEAEQADPTVDRWIVIGENALPNIPGRLYVQKTGSEVHIWRTRTETRLERGVVPSISGSRLSEQQTLDLLNGIEPAGWEIIYLDETGTPIPEDS